MNIIEDSLEYILILNIVFFWFSMYWYFFL